MISRPTIALSVAVLGAALFAPSVPAQGRGMRGLAATPQSRSSFRHSGRDGFDRPFRRRYWNGSAFLLTPYFYPDDEIDYGPIAQEEHPVQEVVTQPVQPPAPAASPVESLILENRDGQWVRIPTGSQMQAIPQSTKPDSAQVSSVQPGIAGPTEAAQPVAELPPAVLVFHDGHREEVERYMIRGDVLFTTANYWSTGSWTRKIPLAELDVPASLKLNKERGTKFNLPSGPNEVVVRF